MIDSAYGALLHFLNVRPIDVLVDARRCKAVCLLYSNGNTDESLAVGIVHNHRIEQSVSHFSAHHMWSELKMFGVVAALFSLTAEFNDKSIRKTHVSPQNLSELHKNPVYRQFLFRHRDIGRPKATVAAEAIMSRAAGCKVVAHHAKIQDFGANFYSDVSVIVRGHAVISLPAALRWQVDRQPSVVQALEHKTQHRGRNLRHLQSRWRDYA